MTASPWLTLDLTSDGGRASEDETVNLVDELSGVHGLDVDRVRSAAPAGSKALDVSAIGTVLLSLSGAGTIPALLGVLKGWISRQPGRSVVVQIGDNRYEVTGASREEEHELREAFLASLPHE